MTRRPLRVVVARRHMREAGVSRRTPWSGRRRQERASDRAPGGMSTFADTPRPPTARMSGTPTPEQAVHVRGHFRPLYPHRRGVSAVTDSWMHSQPTPTPEPQGRPDEPRPGSVGRTRCELPRCPRSRTLQGPLCPPERDPPDGTDSVPRRRTVHAHLHVHVRGHFEPRIPP
jgi:hypothetical protein